MKKINDTIMNYWMEDPCGLITIIRKNGIVEYLTSDEFEEEIRIGIFTLI